MAEPANLTQAEILARQRMLEEALARQNADAEIFGRVNDPRPKERPKEYEYGALIDYGPEGQLPVDMAMDRILGEGALLQGAVAGARDLFTGERREVLEPATVTYKDLPDRFNPLTGRFEPRTEETITPGRYGAADKSFKYTPLYQGIASAGQFIEDMLQDPKKRDEALEMIKQFPEMLDKQARLTAESAIRGERVVDTESGMSGLPSDLLLATTGFMGAGRAAMKLPDDGVTFGAFGGSSSGSGRKKIKEYERLVYEEGMPEEVAQKSTGVFIGPDGQPRVYLGPIDVNDSAISEAAGLSGNVLNRRVSQAISMLPLKMALDPNSSQVLFEYPELQDVNLVVVPTKEGAAPNAKEVMEGYQQAALRLYGTPESGLDGVRKELITDNFYDPVSNTIYVRHDYERPAIRKDRPDSPISEYQIQQMQRQQVQLNQKIGEGIQNYIQQREGFAPVETVPEVMKELSANPVYSDRHGRITENLASELDPQAAQTILDNKNEAVQTFRRSVFRPLDEKFDQKVRERNEEANHKNTFPTSNPFRAEDLSANLSAMFVAAPRTPEYKNQKRPLQNLYGVNFYIDDISDETTNKLTEIFAGSPNEILTLINNNTFGGNSAAKFMAAAKVLREAPELRQTDSTSWISSFKPKLSESAERKAIEFETAASVYLDAPEESFKTLFDTVVRADEQTFLYRQALSALDRPGTGVQNVLSAEGYNPNIQVFAPGAAEVRLASDILNPERKQAMFGDAEPSAAALEMSLRDPGLISNQIQILPPAAKQAYKKGEQYTEDLARQAKERGIDRYDPSNPFFSRLNKSLESIKRETGNVKEWIKDLRKKATGQGVTEKELEILGLDERIKEVGRVLENYTDGKLSKSDLSLLLQTIDRPIEVVDLSKTDPDLNSKYRNTLLGGGPATQNSKTFIWKQPPKEGDREVFVEGHWNADTTGIVKSTPDIVLGKDPQIKHPNTFMHARTTVRKDGDEEHFLLEELQSEALQKSGKSGNVPLLKDKGAARSLAVETLLLKASERGSDTFSILPGYAVRYVQGQDKDYGPEYDEKLPSVLKKLAKRYGGKYDEQIPILVTDSSGRPLTRDAFDIPDDGSARSAASRELLRNVEEMFDENTGQTGLYVMARGIRLTPEQKQKILKSQIGRADGGEVYNYAKGGMVTNMNRPVISRGLSNLIRSYSQGPLARLDVPRGTVPVQGMFNGGVPRNFNPFDVPTGGPMTEREKEVQAQMAAEALADNAPLPPIPLNQAQQKAYRAGLLQMDDLGYGPNVQNKEFLYSGDTGIPAGTASTTVPPQEQGTSGPADTSPIEDSPASPPIQQTLQDAPASDPTVPFTPLPPVETTTTQPTTTQPTTTQPTTTTLQPPTQPVSLPFKNPNELSEARAAEEAAAAEAERIRLANLAAQEQMAAEQLAAEEAARVAAEAEQQRLLEAAETAAQAEEQERIALDQQLAQELAAQEQAQLAAQQNIDSQVSGAEQLAAQQAADRAANEAAIAAAPMPTAVFQAPTPSTVDRGSFGVPPEEGTQVVDPNAPNFLVADMIKDYTSGYAPTLGMDIKETVYPYQGLTQQEMQDQGVYQAEVFQPMPKLSFGTGDAEETEGEQSASSDPEINWDIGSTRSGGPGTGPGRYVDLPTGGRVWVPDFSGASFNTENPESEAGQYGLTDQQRYQCPGYYTLAFEGGQPYCKKVDKSQWPSGGQQRVRVSNLPSRTAVQVVETNQPGSETQEGYAQGGPVQNFNYGGFVNRPSLQQQIQQAQPQGPFGQALFQRFGQYQQPQQPRHQLMPQHRPQQPQFMPQPFQPANQDMRQWARSQPAPPPSRLSTGEMKLENLIPTPGGPLDTQPGFLGGGDDRFSPMASSADMGLNGRPSVDNTGKFMDNVTGEIVDRRAGPDTFTAGFQGGQMGPPQQIGQVAEPNTQQLASQLQNVTQQVNQLSSHLGVSGGGMTQGPSQYQPGGLQGGIGGLLQNLRPGPPPPQYRATGPVRPPMLQMTGFQ